MAGGLMADTPYTKPSFKRKSPQEIVQRLFTLAAESDIAAMVLKACLSDDDSPREEARMSDPVPNS
jgi:hypothetical protein